MNIVKNPKYKIFMQWAALAVLVGVLLTAVYFFVFHFEALRRGGAFRGHIRHQVAGQIISPDQIRGWMTFRYVNLVFGLPPLYLQGALNIKDSRYPNLSIDSLAKEQKLNSVQLVAKAVASVKVFINKPHP